MMPSPSRLKILAGISASFTGLAVLIIALAVTHAISFQMGLLMLIGLVGLYVGFGVLALVYRFISRLQ